MSRSSCGSWRGGAGAAPDIIDLDRFMRAGVRPSDPISTDDDLCERLLVDAGAGHKPVPSARVRRGGVQGGAPSSTGESSRAHHKRYSHDSGLSGDSYARRSRKPHRRLSVVRDVGRASRDTVSDRNTNKCNSVRAFREVCERALLDQQQQIARITQLCERLAERHVEPRVERAARQPISADTSEISSSSRSTRDQRRKDKHRTEECKTYKIIMNKLDELNRLFASRGHSPPARSASSPRARAAPPLPLPLPLSSSSVSTHDEPLSARPLTTRTPIYPPTSSPQVIQTQVAAERAVGDGSVLGSALGSALGSQKRRVVRAVTQACSVDIAPAGLYTGKQKATPNVTIESVVKRDSSCEASGSSRGRYRCAPRFDFDQNDSAPIYAQSKRKEAFHINTAAYRAHSLERASLLGERRDEWRGERRGEWCGEPRGGRSLCALCRGCWRSVRHYVTAQIFCRPDNSL